MLTIETVALEEKQVLRNLMQLYKYDFTVFDPEDVDVMGLYDYPYLDYYFVEHDRQAYFIKIKGVLAGFALVRSTVLTQTKEPVWELVEYFVLKKYRREGVGSQAARRILDKHQGKWKIGVMANNTPALAFWRKITTAYDPNTVELEEKDWEGIFLVLESKKEGY
ncbi:GNAT family N-acetyltransferase [Myroides sp. NP-2]|uniref:GNAT family N-acetyltransferase n=1 Tax=Myroides sp. NP-2 TaxID=2759945 RepID=UPI0015FC57A7|nr:GNAT family N-acetyltransferase [Myroides sp. NP-2]MBB1149901.1 GNAT family N-acetyltransferase [Myroides sp. NP-2]